MKIERASKIATLPDMVNVTYNGSPVYIEKVNEINNTAYVHLLSKPEDQIKVLIANLKEQE